ncbi:hypothetical protein [Timonella sp. A28]|uniref:hypothetical protein n=1 Tax=Timonella sp. A28 TaxID=3442640 RepID=UPI003EB91AE5
MATFHSPKYPSLRVADLGLRFQDGVLEMEEGPRAERLRGLSSFEVVEVATEADQAAPVAVEDTESHQDSKGTDTQEPKEETVQAAPSKRRSRTS